MAKTVEWVLATQNPHKSKEIQNWVNALLKSPAAIESLGKNFKCVVSDISNLPPCPEPHDTFLENAIAKAKYAAKNRRKLSLADDSGLCIPFLGHAPGVLSANFSDDFFNFARKYFADADPLVVEEDEFYIKYGAYDEYEEIMEILLCKHLSFEDFIAEKNKGNSEWAHIVANDEKHQYHIYCLQYTLMLAYCIDSDGYDPSSCDLLQKHYPGQFEASIKKFFKTVWTKHDFLNFKTPAYYHTTMVLASHGSPDLKVAQAKWNVEFHVRGHQGAQGCAGFGYDSHIFIPELNCYVSELNIDQKNKISHRGQALQKMGEMLLECILENKDLI